MKAAVITMVYNESVNLPLWRSYYGKVFGEKNLYVVDHGTDDGSTDSINYNRILLPREVYDNEQRAAFISKFHGSLLHYYDAVIYTDCDEFIVANPAKYSDLKDFIEKNNDSYFTTIGLNVVHDIHNEPDLDWSKGILAQRKYAYFLSSMCKPTISRRPISWTVGFHGSNYFPRFSPDLYMFHIKHIDLQTNLKRQNITRNLPWKDDRHGHHQRLSDEELKNNFNALMAREKKNDEPFLFEQERRRFCDETRLRGNGAYLVDYFESNVMLTIPQRFKDVF